MIYAKLNFPFSKQSLVREIQNLPREAFQRITPTRFEKSKLPYQFNPGMAFPICSPEEYEQLSYDYYDGHDRHHHEGYFKSYTHLILTHPNVPESEWYLDNVKNHEGKLCRPYILHQYPWSWRTDIVLPELRSTIERLPFEYVQRVRVIVLWEGEHIGNVHRDSVPYFTQPWQRAGHGVINLNLRDGGSVLRLELPDKTLIDINDDCFIFDESLFHGTTRGNQLRIQVNVTGKFCDSIQDYVENPPVQP